MKFILIMKDCFLFALTVHTDLKIENILLQGQRLNFGGPHSRYPGNAIKIIDFGGVCAEILFSIEE